MSDQLQVTPATQWKRQTEIVLLPSGVTAELQRPSTIDTILTDGNLPDGLAQVMIAGLITGEEAEMTIKGSDLPAIADLVKTLCRAAFVSPKIVDESTEPNYDKNEIALADVKDVDRMFILAWVTNAGGKAKAAGKFRDKQARNVSALPNGKDVREKTR
jgi:hypothetical protein